MHRSFVQLYLCFKEFDHFKTAEVLAEKVGRIVKTNRFLGTSDIRLMPAAESLQDQQAPWFQAGGYLLMHLFSLFESVG